MIKIDYTPEEEIIKEVILDARKVQDFLWGDISLLHQEFNSEFWSNVFAKRVIKISEIKSDNPNYKVELKKRILQQAALSVLALRIVDKL